MELAVGEDDWSLFARCHRSDLAEDDRVIESLYSLRRSALETSNNTRQDRSPRL